MPIACSPPTNSPRMRSAMLDLQLMQAGGQSEQERSARLDRNRRQIKENWQAYLATTLLGKSPLIAQLIAGVKARGATRAIPMPQMKGGNGQAVQAMVALGPDYAPIESPDRPAHRGSAAGGPAGGERHRKPPVSIRALIAGSLVPLVMAVMALVFLVFTAAGARSDALYARP